MLPQIVRLNSGMSHRSRWSLVLLGVALLALPTWYQEAQSQQFASGERIQTSDTEVTGPEPKGSKPAQTADKPQAAAGVVSQERDVKSTKSRPYASAQDDSLKSPFKAVIATAVKRPKLPVIAPPAIEYFPEPSQVEKKIQAALDRNVDRTFVDAYLHEIQALLAEVYEIQCVVDTIALKEEAIDLNKTMFSLDVRGIPLRSWLKLILDEKRLRFVVADDVVKITTDQKAKSMMVVRTYPVRDLVSNVDADYAQLSQAIQNGVAGDDHGNEFWLEVDGEGGAISIMPSTGSLVVRQTWRAHESVLQLLRALRSANADSEIKDQGSLSNATK